ncbi:diacylglycerol/lipid kinase family protein [Nocardia sp. CA-119907]|uniref:diacylglycerol/lipid kinase family protein n=1 Tax=Nocardia sp. CA-119907 TaxID=3239973 RepID=UPI003D95295B
MPESHCPDSVACSTVSTHCSSVFPSHTVLHWGTITLVKCNAPVGARLVAVVHNPVSGAPDRGGSDARRVALETALAAHDVPVLWFEAARSDTGTIATHKALAAGADLVIAAGGDGTVASCANVLIGQSVPLAIVPTGTGNIVATSLRSPVVVEDAVENALHGDRRRVDLGVVDSGRAFFAGSIGFSAAVMRDATATLKGRIGMFAYAASALKHLRDPLATFTIQVDDEPPMIRRAHAILIGNFGEIMTKPRLARTALDDGIVEVGVLRVKPLLDWIRQDRPILRLRRPPPLDWFQATTITVCGDQPYPWECDGDYVGISARLEFQVLPRSLWVCAPDPTAASEPKRSLSGLVSRDVARLLPWT